MLREELAAGRWKVTEAIAAAGQCKMVDFDEEEWFAEFEYAGGVCGGGAAIWVGRILRVCGIEVLVGSGASDGRIAIKRDR